MVLSDFVFGLIVGLFVGILVGIMWTKAFMMISDGVQEKKERKKSQLGRVELTGILILLLSIYLVGLGVFQVYNYHKRTEFVACQAEYNQRSAVSRDARSEAMTAENRALYDFLRVFVDLVAKNAQQPPNTPPDPNDVSLFSETLKNALRTHDERIETEKTHPYPENPDDFCGPVPSNGN